MLALRVVAFLMDAHEEVMRPPEDLAVLTHRRLALRHRSQVVGEEGEGVVVAGERRQWAAGSFMKDGLTLSAGEGIFKPCKS